MTLRAKLLEGSIVKFVTFSSFVVTSHKVYNVPKIICSEVLLTTAINLVSEISIDDFSHSPSDTLID